MSDYTVFSKNLTYLSFADSSVSHFVNVPLPALKTLVMNDGQLPAEAMTRRLRDILRSKTSTWLLTTSPTSHRTS